VRNRYVWQVLLATFGFAMVLAVIAVMETPADWPPRATDAQRAPAELRLCSTNKPSAHSPSAAAQTDSFRDKCKFPARPISDKAQSQAQCVR
jgi:hypothetical protein